MSVAAADAVVFDMDGILIDSEPLMRLAAKGAAAALGHSIDDATYVSWMGLPPQAVEAAIVRSMGPGFPFDDFRERFIALFNDHTERHGMPAQPGIAALLAALESRGVPFAVATSTRREQAERSLALAGLADRLDILVCGDEVEAGKPDPEIFVRAAGRLGIAPERCVALEDSAVGVRAAAGARMLTVMVPDLLAPPPEVAQLARYVLPSTEHAARVVLALFDARRAPA